MQTNAIVRSSFKDSYIIALQCGSVYYFKQSQYFPLLSDLESPIYFDLHGQIIFSVSKLYIFNPSAYPQLLFIKVPWSISSACIVSSHLYIAPSDTQNACLFSTPLSSISSNRLEPTQCWSFRDSRVFTSLLPLPITSSSGYILAADNKARVSLFANQCMVTLLKGRRNAILGIFQKHGTGYGYIYLPHIGILEYFEYASLSFNCFSLESLLVQVSVPLHCKQIDIGMLETAEGDVISVESLVGIDDDVMSQQNSPKKSSFGTLLTNSLKFLNNPNSTEDVQTALEIFASFEREIQGKQNPDNLLKIRKYKSCLSMYFSLHQSSGVHEHRRKSLTLYNLLKNCSKSVSNPNFSQMISRHLIELSKNKPSQSLRVISFSEFSDYLVDFSQSSSINDQVFKCFHTLLSSSCPSFIIKDFIDWMSCLFGKQSKLIAHFLLCLFKSIPINESIMIDLFQVEKIFSDLSAISQSASKSPSVSEIILQELSRLDSFTEILLLFHCPS
ncbi:hypothetical protein GEMRC1_007437 [Eukaryota sp. GEM-RC1]